MTIPALSRRGFIKSVACTAAGVSFALSLSACTSGSREVEGGNPGIELLSWVVFRPDGKVVIRVPQTEIGQGVSTTIPQMIAEELELDWASVLPEFYDPALNASRDNPYVWTTTLSSSSAHLLFEPIQQVGAQMRAMLMAAAAARLKVPEAELKAANGKILHDVSGRTVSFHDVARDATRIEPPDPGKLNPKPADARRFIGKPIKRNGIADMVRGQYAYAIDVELEGMRYAAIRHAPTYGGKLINFDRSSIDAMSGHPEAVEIKGGKVGYNSPVPEGEDPEVWAAPVFVDDAVAVVADSWWQAKSAMERLEVKWKPGPHAKLNSEEIRSRLSRRVRGTLPVADETGNVEKALAEAKQRLSADYHYPYMDPAPLEPMTCTALFEGGEVHVWTDSQYPDDAWRLAYEIGGVSPDKAHLHLMPAGGGFGRRLQNDFVYQALHIAKAHRGTPIKLLWTREESIKRSYYAPVTAAHFDGALDGAGKITAWRCRVASGQAAEQSYGATRFPYRPANARFEYQRDKNLPFSFGWMRGVGFAQHLWMNFSFLDELRLASGRDVATFYRELLDPEKIPTGIEGYDGAVERAQRNRRIFDHAVKNGPWRSPKPAGLGRGIAVSDSDYYQGYRSATKAAIVDVRIDQGGIPVVEHVYIAVDAGTVINPDIVQAQLEGGVAFALTNALMSEITLEAGAVQQSNFHDYPILKMDRMPPVQIDILPSDGPPFGIGEDSVPITIAALINAIADAGGPRIRELPIRDRARA